MSLPRTLRVVVAAAIALSAVAVGAGVLSAGAASSTTYYACLKSGTLSKVGTTAPTCTSPATQISWSQTGPQGPAGPAGAAGNTILSGTGAPTSTIGAAGNFYLETSNHTIYGPATRNCNVLPCKTVWGNGTSLVGPQGPSGQGVAYDTQTQAVNDPSGQFETVLTQTLPVGGDFQVVADVTGQNSAGNSVDWQCVLEAANPGGAIVGLGRADATNTGNVGAPSAGTSVGNETSLSLQGVVSIAAGGTVSVYCGEPSAMENDSFEYAHITSTQVSGLSIVSSS